MSHEELVARLALAGAAVRLSAGGYVLLDVSDAEAGNPYGYVKHVATKAGLIDDLSLVLEVEFAFYVRWQPTWHDCGKSYQWYAAGDIGTPWRVSPCAQIMGDQLWGDHGK